MNFSCQEWNITFIPLKESQIKWIAGTLQGIIRSDWLTYYSHATSSGHRKYFIVFKTGKNACYRRGRALHSRQVIQTRHTTQTGTAFEILPPFVSFLGVPAQRRGNGVSWTPWCYPVCCISAPVWGLSLFHSHSHVYPQHQSLFIQHL